jgi:Mn2+/Fe2+ NRAMP family transporter
VPSSRASNLARLRRRRYLGSLGPGIVAGASDADPTTVATLAVIGAGTMYGLAWLTLLLFPMIAIVQAISTQVGLTTGQHLQKAVVERHGTALRWSLLLSILAVNVLTIAADLEGGAAAIGLLLNVDWRIVVVPFSIVLIGALVLLSYRGMQTASLLLLPFVLAYAGAVILARPQWLDVLRGSFIPHFEWTNEYLDDALSLLGTTLTSYVYVWQTIAQSEGQPRRAQLRPRQVDAVVGSFFAVATFWLILVATGATLGPQHLRVDTAADAARTLRPIAGPFAGGLFAIGLLVSSMIALPVIMSTTAYVVGAQFNWRGGLSLGLTEAPRFYGALACAVALGVALAYSGISTIRLLFIAGIVGGIATPLGLVALLRLAGDRRSMRGEPVGRGMLIAGWATTGLIGALSLAFIASQIARAAA